MKKLILLFVMFIPLLGMTQEQEKESAPSYYNIEGIQECEDSISEPSEIMGANGVVEIFPEKRYVEFTVNGKSWKYVLIKDISDKEMYESNQVLWKMKNVKGNTKYYLGVTISSKDPSYVRWDIIRQIDLGFVRFYSKKISEF